MTNLYFLKLGGSVITNEDRKDSAKIDNIDRLLRETYEAKKSDKFKIIIGHGGGSFPHIPAKKYRVNEGLINKDSYLGSVITLEAASKLDSIIMNRAIKLGIPLFSFSPHSFGTSKNGEFKVESINGIKTALDLGFIPIVYGDVVLDTNKGVTISSTEDVFSALARKLKPQKIIIATNVDGVFTKNPHIYKDAKLIRHVDSYNIKQVLSLAGDSVRVNVTGGMNSKLLSLYEMVSKIGSKGYIVNGDKSNLLRKILTGNDKTVECTVVK